MVQEIVYRCNDFNAPLHATTFNALGYNKIQKSVNSVYEHIIRKNNITKIITNYYIKFDFVGEGLGHSLTFERYGEDKPAIYIKDIDDVQDSLHLTNKKTRYLGKIKIGLDYSKQELHGINLFYDTIKYGDIYDY